MVFKSNINTVIAGLREQIKGFKSAIAKAAQTEASWYVRTWIVLKYLQGRPGLVNRGGRAAKSWHSKVKVTSRGVLISMYSQMRDREFNYLKAHEDPQWRNTAFGKPSKRWKLKKRLDIFGDWGTNDSPGPGGKVFTRNIKHAFANFGTT